MKSYLGTLLILVVFLILQVAMGDSPYMIFLTVVSAMICSVTSVWIINKVTNAYGRLFNPTSELSMAVYVGVFFSIMTLGNRMLADSNRALTILVFFGGYTLAQCCAIIFFGKQSKLNDTRPLPYSDDAK